MLQCRCEHCDKRVRVKDEYAGKRVRCAQCKKVFVVAKSSEAAPPTPPKEAPFRPSPRQTPALPVVVPDEYSDTFVPSRATSNNTISGPAKTIIRQFLLLVAICVVPAIVFVMIQVVMDSGREEKIRKERAQERLAELNVVSQQTSERFKGALEIIAQAPAAKENPPEKDRIRLRNETERRNVGEATANQLRAEIGRLGTKSTVVRNILGSKQTSTNEISFDENNRLMVSGADSELDATEISRLWSSSVELADLNPERVTVKEATGHGFTQLLVWTSAPGKVLNRSRGRNSKLDVIGFDTTDKHIAESLAVALRKLIRLEGGDGKALTRTNADDGEMAAIYKMSKDELKRFAAQHVQRLSMGPLAKSDVRFDGDTLVNTIDISDKSGRLLRRIVDRCPMRDMNPDHVECQQIENQKGSHFTIYLWATDPTYRGIRMITENGTTKEDNLGTVIGLSVIVDNEADAQLITAAFRRLIALCGGKSPSP